MPPPSPNNDAWTPGDTDARIHMLTVIDPVEPFVDGMLIGMVLVLGLEGAVLGLWVLWRWLAG